MELQCINNNMETCGKWGWSTYILLKPNAHARIRIATCWKKKNIVVHVKDMRFYFIWRDILEAIELAREVIVRFTTKKTL